METQLRDMPIAFLILARFRRVVGDGQTITLYGGVRGWATWMGCSPGYPKHILNRLAHEGFLTVAYLDDGFAEVTVLPPAELADRTPQERSRPDPFPTACPRRRGRTVPPQSTIPIRSAGDRMSHDHESLELASKPLSPTSARPSAIDDSAIPEASPDLTPAQQIVLTGLVDRQIYPRLAQTIVTQHPDLTLATFDAQVARLAARATYVAPVFVAAKILARGETITETATPPRGIAPPRPSDMIRHATHVPDLVRGQWLDLCAQYPADTAQIVQDFLARYPLAPEVA